MVDVSLAASAAHLFAALSDWGARSLGPKAYKASARMTAAAMRIRFRVTLLSVKGPGWTASKPQRTSRARELLGWQPAYDGRAVLREALAGLRMPTGGPTAPLDPGTSGWLRSHELATGVGERA